MVSFVGAGPTATAPDPPDEPDPPDGGDVPTVTDEYGGTATIAALQTFLDGVDDGAIVGLVAATEYTGNGSAQLHLEGRSLTIVGRGATIKRTAAGTTEIFLMNGGGGPYAFYDLIVQGSKSTSTGKWSITYEHEHAYAVGGAVDVEFIRCEARDVGGDGLYLSGSIAASQWASNIRFHHGTFYNIGRMGVAITDGAEDVTVSYNDFSQIGYYTWDIEPNGATVDGRDAGGLRVTFANNTIGTKPYGDYPTDGTQAFGYLFAATGASGGGPCDTVYIQDNVMSDGAMRIALFNNGVTCSSIVVSGNEGAGTFSPDGDISHVVTYSGVVGGSIQNNTQLCSSPSVFESHSGSSGITVSGNVTT